MVIKATAIRRLREEKDLSRDAFARLTGLSLATLYRIETGKQKPGPETRARMAQALGVREEDLNGE